MRRCPGSPRRWAWRLSSSAWRYGSRAIATCRGWTGRSPPMRSVSQRRSRSPASPPSARAGSPSRWRWSFRRWPGSIASSRSARCAMSRWRWPASPSRGCCSIRKSRPITSAPRRCSTRCFTPMACRRWPSRWPRGCSHAMAATSRSRCWKVAPSPSCLRWPACRSAMPPAAARLPATARGLRNRRHSHSPGVRSAGCSTARGIATRRGR